MTAKVKGPNGNVYELEDAVAAGLVGKGNRGYEYVKDEPQGEPKSTAKRSSSKK